MPVVLILMGAAGAGKTTVGRALSEQLGWPFRDADELHSAAAVDKMRRGEPLSDDDRWPWLARVRDVIRNAIVAGQPLVLACSALREGYRAFLIRDFEDAVTFVYLEASRDLLAARLTARAGHFAHADLLDSQLATLERPSRAITLDAAQPVPRLVEAVRRTLNL